MKGSVQGSLAGLPQIERKLTQLTSETLMAAGRALYEEGAHILTAAKAQAPLDLGPLQNSGYETLPEFVGSRVTVEVGFGGSAADYAEVQHERLSFFHKEPGRKAKYLEDPLWAAAGGLTGRVAVRMRQQQGTVATGAVHPTRPR